MVRPNRVTCVSLYTLRRQKQNDADLAPACQQHTPVYAVNIISYRIYLLRKSYARRSTSQ